MTEIRVEMTPRAQEDRCRGCRWREQKRNDSPMETCAPVCTNPKSVWYLRISHCRCRLKEEET